MQWTQTEKLNWCSGKINTDQGILSQIGAQKSQMHKILKYSFTPSPTFLTWILKVLCMILFLFFLCTERFCKNAVKIQKGNGASAEDKWPNLWLYVPSVTRMAKDNSS